MARKWKATATYAQTRQAAASAVLPIDSDSFRAGARQVSTAAMTATTEPTTATKAESCSRRTNHRPSDEMTQNDALENIMSTVTASAMNTQQVRIATSERVRLRSAAAGAVRAALERPKRRRANPITRINSARMTTAPATADGGLQPRLAAPGGRALENHDGSVAVRHEADDLAVLVMGRGQAHLAADFAPQPRPDLAELLRLVVEPVQAAELEAAVVVHGRCRLAEHIEEAEQVLLGAPAAFVSARDGGGVLLRVGRRRDPAAASARGK